MKFVCNDTATWAIFCPGCCVDFGSPPSIYRYETLMTLKNNKSLLASHQIIFLNTKHPRENNLMRMPS